jgi:hypothetical protein
MDGGKPNDDAEQNREDEHSNQYAGAAVRESDIR